MKHLKTYTLYERVSKETKVFESVSFDVDDVQSTIQDILLELNDEGFDVGCNISGSVITNSKGYSFEIKICGHHNMRDGHLFLWGDIRDTMNRIYDYLSSFELPILFNFVDPSDGEEVFYSTDKSIKVKGDKLFTFGDTGLKSPDGILTRDTLNDTFHNYYDDQQDDIVVYFDLITEE